jgi:acetoin:2,6-dichlorophenolindophenol oxidoreductase subunit alpha
MDHKQLPKDRLTAIYKTMVRIRKFELKVNELFLKGLIPGTIHLSHGQEGVAAGAVSALERDDRIVLTHRPHGQALAKGMEPKRLMAEILGKVGGCCKGKGGSMHIADVQNGVMPSLPIVGAGIPIAAGIAFAFKRDKRGSIAMSFFGDGTTNIGAFHEGLNIAAIWNLPVVFICENNLYAVSTSIRKTSLLENLSTKAASYGISGVTVDGNDVEEVFFSAKGAVDRARDGKGPTLIECKTYRHGGHSRTDPGTYRPAEEVEKWLKSDPLLLCRKKLLERGHLAEEECAALEDEETILINDAAEFAVSSKAPEKNVALEDVLA